MEKDNATDIEIQAQFNERNKNVKQTWNNVVHKVDDVLQSTYVDESKITNNPLASNASNVTNTTPGAGNTLSGVTGTSDTKNKMASWDASLMKSIQDDVTAMHQADAEKFEPVASKMDETFGNNALI
ncbi:hypothetical protein BDB01DRAFT_903126 [Pilobolus umbonatus]|nr:hypothetical protein BDB01DRAFT_903126 [Pilobolus umbonatus]